MWFHCLMKLSKACMGIRSENPASLGLQQKEVSVPLWAYVLVCVCNKTGSYILILTYKELNPIHAAETANLSILEPITSCEEEGI